MGSRQRNDGHVLIVGGGGTGGPWLTISPSVPS